ncbi:hypothetical protein SO802_019808 [Lithocarpus litseifolius]|uniref:Uncharacterized protein n=1 Tax=Lithocarpus litseifolius TaxID=425828 RepID=A0AAW2CPT5_9ROSI
MGLRFGPKVRVEDHDRSEDDPAQPIMSEMSCKEFEHELGNPKNNAEDNTTSGSQNWNKPWSSSDQGKHPGRNSNRNTKASGHCKDETVAVGSGKSLTAPFDVR